jgi:uncharacterized membrane protein
MSTGDFFLVTVRWLHLVSAVAWVGGSLFCLLVLRPAIRRAPDSGGLVSATAGEFRTLVNTSIVVLVATGVVLAFDRLADGLTDAPYATTLAVKTVLSVWMFVLVRSEQRRSAVLASLARPSKPESTRFQRIRGAVSGYNAIVILGLVVLFLSDLLNGLFTAALTRN